MFFFFSLQDSGKSVSVSVFCFFPHRRLWAVNMDLLHSWSSNFLPCKRKCSAKGQFFRLLTEVLNIAVLRNIRMSTFPLEIDFKHAITQWWSATVQSFCNSSSIKLSPNFFSNPIYNSIFRVAKKEAIGNQEASTFRWKILKVSYHANFKVGRAPKIAALRGQVAPPRSCSLKGLFFYGGRVVWKHEYIYIYNMNVGKPEEGSLWWWCVRNLW